MGNVQETLCGAGFQLWLAVWKSLSPELSLHSNVLSGQLGRSGLEAFSVICFVKHL